MYPLPSGISFHSNINSYWLDSPELALQVGSISEFNNIFFYVLHSQYTRSVADQSNHTNLPLLCIKLSLAMGLTWILGFIESFAQVELLGYLFVILNSLQGKSKSCGENTLPYWIILILIKILFIILFSPLASFSLVLICPNYFKISSASLSGLFS